MDIHYSAE